MRPPHSFDFGSETADDAVASSAATQSRLDTIEERLHVLANPEMGRSDNIKIAQLNKEAASALLDLNQNNRAWHRARPLFDAFLNKQQWQEVIEICEILFRTEQAGSLAALGHGVWLAVTYPVNPQMTTTMLQYVIEETPDDSDGAAVAAATAAYVYDLRKELTDNSDLYLQTMQMMTSVARRHSDASDQSAFDEWVERLELNNPQKFLVRLRNVIDVLVQDDWWFDRDMLQANLPDS